MGYFVASCVVTWLALGVYVLVLFSKSRRLSERIDESGNLKRD